MPLFYLAIEIVFEYVDVKSSPVHFSVGRSGSFDKINKIIPYNIENLNAGNSMDLKTGILQYQKPESTNLPSAVSRELT